MFEVLVFGSDDPVTRRPDDPIVSTIRLAKVTNYSIRQSRWHGSCAGFSRPKRFEKAPYSRFRFGIFHNFQQDERMSGILPCFSVLFT